MKPIHILLILTVFVLPAFANDTTRVLFIGNSFTYFHNMPKMVEAFADSAGLSIYTAMHAPGGVSVGDTIQGNQAHMNNPLLFKLIRSKKWDVVVIQDNQGRFVRDSALFPASSKVVEGHLKLMDSVKAVNSCAKIILFGGWAFKYGSPPYGNTGTEMIRRILRNYVVLNTKMNETVAPIGEAWIKAIQGLPAVNLWDPDDAHPGYAGSYLTAGVIFSTIFNTPIKNNSFSGSISPTASPLLKLYSDSAVFHAPFRKKYNVGGAQKLTPYHVNDHLTLPPAFTATEWYKDGVMIGSGPTCTPQGDGWYSAHGKDTSGCLVKTCSYYLLTTGAQPLVTGSLMIFPNPVNDGYFTIEDHVPVRSVELVNVSGHITIPIVEQEAGRTKIVIPDLSPGCYTIIVYRNALPALFKKILIAK